MKINPCILCLLVALFAGQARGDLIRVYLQAGQSNGDGRAESSGLPTTPVNLQQPQTDVEFFFRVEGPHPWEDGVIDLKPGSPEFDQTNFFGPEVTFGRSMADFYAPDPTTSVAIIKYANGATNLYSQWKAGGTSGSMGDGSEYVRFQSTVSAGLDAIRAAHPSDTVVISGMIWHQGEADAHYVDRAAEYEASLTNFIADVRSTYVADLPFVIGEIVDNGPNFQTVRAAQAAVAAANSLNGFVGVDGFPLKDAVHFNASGQQLLGSGFATQMQALPEPTMAPNITPNVLAHWSFDTNFHDVSGNGNDGTAFDGNSDSDTDGVRITTTAGEYKFGGGAADFADERDYVDIPEQTLHSGREYSIAFWAKRESTSDWDMVIGQPDNASHFIAFWSSGSDQLRWRSINSDDDRQADFATDADTDWHHYVIVAEDADSDSSIDDITFYRDGAFVGTDTDNMTGFTFDAIGEAYTSGADFDFNGQIDEVWLFDEAIDPMTVSNLYNFNDIIRNADFDTDGNVDGVDFLTWQRGFGATGGLMDGDANGDGVVNGADSLIWQSQFGNCASATAAVPEPTSLTLVFIATLLGGAAILRVNHSRINS